MNVSQVHSKVNELQTCFNDQQYDDAQLIMQDFLDSFPDYQTPMFMYIRLMPVVDSENPLYLKILELTRHYHQLSYFPGDLVPDWYEKIGTRNLEIVLPVAPEAVSVQQVSAPVSVNEIPAFADESDVGESIDHMFPDQVPYEEEPETPSTMFDPHSLADDEPILSPNMSNAQSFVAEPELPAVSILETEPDQLTEIDFAAESGSVATSDLVETEVELPADPQPFSLEDEMSSQQLETETNQPENQFSEPGINEEIVSESASFEETEMQTESEPFSTDGFLTDDDNVPSSLLESDFLQDQNELTGFEDDGTVEFEPDQEQDDEILIASETMAKIFAQQGKFDKAIKVYRMLMEEEPDMMDHFLQKVQELQKMSSENNS
ncbi:MAG: hypothetical protein J0L62_09310 [Bacteroidetes bacterium]|nr:hypothetical protein [Bacteroidota bacterium]